MNRTWATSATGTTQYPLLISVKERNRATDAEVYTLVLNDSVLRHNRSSKVTNRRGFIAGTSSLWIPPSSYSRSQGSMTYTSRADLLTSRLYYHQDCPLHPSLLTAAWPWIDREPLSWWSGYHLTNGPDPTSFPYVNAVNMATTKALLDLSGAKANLGEALATARQTVDLLGESTIRLLRFIRAFKSGRLLSAVKSVTPKTASRYIRSGSLSRDLANEWLKFHYGWKPLAQDVYGTYELLREQLALPRALLVHGRGRSSYSNSGSCRSPSVLTGSSRRVGISASASAKIDVQVGLTGLVQGSGIIRAVNEAGLVNPLSLAWELVPYSFVLDWIVPVGNVFQALSATAGLSFQGGCRTVRFEKTFTASSLEDASKDGKSKAEVIWDTFGFSRSALQSFPTAAPYVKPFYTGGDRWATIASLLYNIRRQFRR